MTPAPFGWKEASMQAFDHAAAHIQVGRAMLHPTWIWCCVAPLALTIWW